MFKDEQGNELRYWPISNLAEGESSEVIRIKLDAPTSGKLKASVDSRARVWAKWTQFPSNPFVNISNGQGIPLDGIPGPYAVFDIYVEALSPIDVFERVPITVVASVSVPAGWTK